MPNESQREEPGIIGTVVGLLVFALVLYGGYRMMVGLANYFSPTPEISLTAFFKPADDPDAKLNIKGEVRELGQPKDRNLRVTVAKRDGSFQQSVYVNSVKGQFDVQDDSFVSLKPKDQLLINVEVWYSQFFSPATRELYLNSRAPAITKRIVLWSLLISGLLVLVVFFYSFTGTKTPLKNRIAIIFSYCIIGMFLAVPLLAPVLLLYVFPNARRAMVGQPAGLVVTKAPQDRGEIQWALNIGGYSTLVKPGQLPERGATEAASPSPTPPRTGSPATSPRTATSATPVSTPSPAGQSPQTSATPSPTATRPQSSPTPAAATAQPTAVAAPTASPTSSPAQVRSSPTPAEPGEDEDLAPEIVDVRGGLVIPLYVIILSVIGGAINMTRKVPRLQREGEYSDVGSTRGWISKWMRSMPVLQRLVPRPTRPQQETIKDQADPQHKGGNEPAGQPALSKPSEIAATPPETMKSADIAKELDKLVAKQTARRRMTEPIMRRIRLLVDQIQKNFAARKDDEPPVLDDCETYEDWASTKAELKELLGTPWRVELLYQYMYLISAPFLAIVAYYMLELLGLTKQPIIVLISFSVGLISEKILSWLLGLASGYLRTESK
jgi:hypothetical protein